MKQSVSERFHTAAKTGNLVVVEELLASLTPSEASGLFPDAMLGAVTNGHSSVVERLLQAGANPEGRNSSGALLLQAASRGYLDMVKMLLGAGAGLDRMFNGMTACQVAMGNERWEVVELLRAKGAAWANPLLHYAARHGDLKRLQEALAGGADVNCIANDPRETPLMAAAGNGQAAAIRLLIAHGADPRKQAGRVPVLYLATVFGRNIEAIEVLLTAGAKTDADFDGVTPLMAAAKRGDLEVVKLLLTHGANPNARNRHRMLSVLDYAMEGKAKKCIELLRMSGATSCREESRSLAHMLAKEFGGKPVNGDGWKGVVTAHFSVRSVLTGFPCEFVVGPEGFIVRLERVRFKEPVFSGRRDSAFNFSATPSGQHPDYHEVPAATQEFGKPVFRRGKTSPTDQALIRFFRQNRAVLTELALTGEEQVEVWNDGVAIAILAADWSKARMRLAVH